jgi:hypothetical protein
VCRYRVNAPRRFPVGCAVITLRPKLSPQVISPQVITPHRRSCAAVVQRTGYARGVAIVHPPRKMPRCAPHKFCKSYQISPQHEPQRRPTATPRRVRRVAALSYTFSAFLFLVALFLIACAGLVVASPRRSSRPSLARASWPWLVGPYYHATLCHAAICLLFGSVVWLAVHLVELSQPAEHPVVSLSYLYL